MKIIDENGAVLTTEPDLEAGYLVEDVEVIHHDAVEGTAPQWHRETAIMNTRCGKPMVTSVRREMSPSHQPPR